MYSHRFQRSVHLTYHARLRMAERNISEAHLMDIIERGTIKHKDNRRLWLFKTYPERNDNMLCAAVLLEQALIVKTVMHHFQPGP